MWIVKKYVAYLVYDEDSPTDFTLAYEVGNSPMPAIFEQQVSLNTQREALTAARQKAKELNIVKKVTL